MSGLDCSMLSSLKVYLSQKMSELGSHFDMSISDVRRALTERCRTGFNPCDEILPGLFLGGVESAKNIPALKQVGITHVLNCAYVPGDFCVSNTNDGYYKAKGVQCIFKGISAHDCPSFPIHNFFEEAADFIAQALDSNGKVLVHCYVGVSRSAALVIAYLMIKKDMNVVDATKFVRHKRHIFPNQGFLQQLCNLEKQLKKKRKEPTS